MRQTINLFILVYTQNLEADIQEYAPFFSKIFEIGENTLQETADPQRKEIEDELTDVKNVWYQLNALLDDRRIKITNVEPLATLYQKALQALANVMAKTEEEVDELEVLGAEPEKVRQQLEKLQVSSVIDDNFVALSSINRSWINRTIFSTVSRN